MAYEAFLSELAQPSTSAVPLKHDEEHDEIDKMLPRFVYMRDGNSVIDLDQQPQNAVMAKTEFDNCFGNLVETGKGVPKITTQWLNHPDRQTVLGERYDPNKPII